MKKMIDNEILKIRPIFEELRARMVRDINEAYSRGLPFFLIDSIIEGLQYQLKPMMDNEVYIPPVESPSVEETQSELPEAPVEEKGEQE